MREYKAKVTAIVSISVLIGVVLLFGAQQLRNMQALENEIDPAAWADLYPLHYAAFLRGAEVGAGPLYDKLAANPFRVRAWAGNPFALEYNASRAHYYAQIDQAQSRRTQERQQPAGCINCHAAEAPALIAKYGWQPLHAMDFEDIQHEVHHGSSCADCHAPDTMALRITRPALLTALAKLDIDVNKTSRHEMRSYVCAQCHVEYYFRIGTQELVFPWANGLRVDDMETFFDTVGFSDWQHTETGAGMIKIQHPNFELHSQGVHAEEGTSCADCHMPTIQDGGMRVTDHHIRSPMTQMQVACMSCHRSDENRLTRRTQQLQDNTDALMANTETALSDLMDAIVAAMATGADEQTLAAARQAHRSAQLRWDFIDADASRGFHAPSETVRLLNDAINIARSQERVLKAITD